MLESISQTDTSADLKHNRFNWNPKVSWEYEQSRKGKKKKSNNLEKVNHREISEELEISRPLWKRDKGNQRQLKCLQDTKGMVNGIKMCVAGEWTVCRDGATVSSAVVNK